MLRHCNIIIEGDVQGVNFRWLSQANAGRLGLAGFAQNKEGGSLFIAVEGDLEKINEFLHWCHLGPSLAKVQRVEANFSEQLQGYQGFEILG